MIEHKENCLIINRKQSVKLKSGSISFKNHFKQLPVPFRIYADFECISKNVERDFIKNNSSYTERYQSHIPCSFAYKVVCIDNKFSKNVVLIEEKMLFPNLLKQFLVSIVIVGGEGWARVGRVIKNHFNKNLTMSTEEEEIFQLANICWICDESFDVGDDKVRDHCHITGKYRGASH